MPETTYRARSAWSIENEHVRVTVLREGGHVAEILSKQTGVNPLWTPPWDSIEPSAYSPEKHPEYGADAESRLLAGIMGHNLCMDIFGGVSAEEAAAGLVVHGEASVARYEISGGETELTMKARFPAAQLEFVRRISLLPSSSVVEFHESVENLTATDRPIGWTQHVTLGPPFLEKGITQFRASATRSKVFESDFGVKGYMKIGAEFDWPMVPRSDRGLADMRVFTDQPASAAFTTHLMDLKRTNAYFTAYSPKSQLAFGYVWRREDFPWLGIWEENRSRIHRPWNRGAITRGMEFGVSPMPETRRQMIARGSLFGVPAFRWIPAGTRVEARYRAAIGRVAAPPAELEWSEKDGAGLFEVRRALPADMPSVAAIQSASPEAAQWPVEDYARYELRVAVEGGVVAGFLAARRVAPGESEILNLAVAPGYRRGGAGRALLGAWATEAPGDIYLEVREFNTAARRFYQTFGFEEVTVRKGYYQAPPEGAIVLKFHSC